MAEESCTMVAGLVTWTKCIVYPIPGMNGSAPALLLFLNNAAPSVMCYRTCWPAWKTHEKKGQEMCVETYGFVCLSEKWKYWLQTACLGQSMTSPLLCHRLVISTVMLLAPRQQSRWLTFPNSERRITWRNANN